MIAALRLRFLGYNYSIPHVSTRLIQASAILEDMCLMWGLREQVVCSVVLQSVRQSGETSSDAKSLMAHYIH